MTLTFSSNSTTSSKYEGVDTEMALCLSTLYLHCHRPTLAALMSLGTDMGAAGTLLAANEERSRLHLRTAGVGSEGTAGGTPPPRTAPASAIGSGPPPPLAAMTTHMHRSTSVIPEGHSALDVGQVV